LQPEALETSIELNQPGDQVILNHQGIVKQNRVNASLYAAWKEEKIYFNNCTVDEIVDLLGDSYNVYLDLTDEQMLNTKLLGSAPSDDPYLIIKALSHILQTVIKVK
jgi:ferric-dicitrate binding protein FerR (iron transport regulator)